MNKPCEYCGCDLPLGVDKKTRQHRSHHFATCKARPVYEVEPPAQQELAATITITQRGSNRTIDNHFEDCVRDWPDGEYKLYTSPQPAQQEPVARQYQSRDGVWKDFISEKHYKDTLEDGSWPIRNLYISPPAQRTWVGLTDEEKGLELLFDTHGRVLDYEDYADAIEAKLKEKNT